MITEEDRQIYRNTCTQNNSNMKKMISREYDNQQDYNSFFEQELHLITFFSSLPVSLILMNLDFGVGLVPHCVYLLHLFSPKICSMH